MNPVVFIAADSRECRHWVSKWSGPRKLALPVHWALSGRWNNQDVIAIANGAGPERAAAAVQAVETLQPRAIVSIGTCGALDSSLQLGDVFVPVEIRAGDSVWPVHAPLGPASATAGIPPWPRRESNL